MGDVVISIDAELAWGYHDLDETPERVGMARDGWQAALDRLDDHGVPATWAIVGHLFLDRCDGRHADHPLDAAWFSCTAGDGPDDDWRAPDLVETVRDRDVGHELASHTFSHVLMNDERTTRAVAAAEFERCQAAADRLDLALDSLVFPRNRVGHRDGLADRGFRCYRGTTPGKWYAGSRFQTPLKLLDWSPLGRAPPLVTPRVDEYGLVNVPASLYLYGFQGRARELAARAGYDPLLAVAKRGVEKAVAGDGVFHAWLHPHNLLQPGGRERFDAFLAYVARRRRETDLRVRTMRDVAHDVLGDDQGTAVAVEGASTD